MDTIPLENKRHTLAHLLAATVRDLYPGAKNAIGPSIDNGFYQDFDLGSHKISEEDFPEIEKRMREILKTWTTSSHREVTPEEAQKEYAWNEYKAELANEFALGGKTITFYRLGDFDDLCKGGHSENPEKEVDPNTFKLDRVAGAYWRGDEKNKMLTRIYGLAFDTKNELDTYLAQREEAKTRDHRKLGAEMDLFITSPLVGAGLPLWTPRGTIVRSELANYIWELRSARGYQKVTIPHITKKELYEISGHWDKFGDELFRITTREGKEYALKPMNCPHHTQIFARKPHSYREMPQRYAETTMVYRDEQSGELGGLTRVLSITQDDSHVFARHSQVKEEFFRIWDIVDTFYKTFGFSLRVRLSFHDPASMDKYLGTPEIWKNAENALRQIAKERGADHFEAPGEAAMYGPKLDFMATDSMGRQHQVATIQLDMNQPERFDLTCVNERGEKERIVMIHGAIMGSIERFTAVLLEHLGGILPTWLSPVQAKILPIGEAHIAFATDTLERLKEAGIRAEIDESGESLGKKIREAKTLKIPYLLVIGDQEVAANTATLEGREGKLGAMPVADIVAKLKEEIATRS
ncbi:MAG TPA: threonine--tRNA ligase [Candidatus Paceibacterota bacterium]|jgi:threonyl-tRNA synthetase|nr:threonine--tRNA ligase [Candidatus Paceibacterota bacterium]